ncbi:MAG: SUMF1/EgtB/PvdO family nonheme iron enzyme [Polyangiaceae bacterium]
MSDGPESAPKTAAQVPIPASAAAATDSPCPPEMARVGSFCVDRYEAVLKERRPDGELVAHPHAERPRAGAVYVAASEPAVYPQAYISRDEAEAACGNAAKRLCNRSEWLLACRGTSPSVVPVDGEMPCNNAKEHLMSKLFGVHPNYPYEDFNSPALDSLPGFLAKTGEFKNCSSDFGVHDMVGNLHEWISDTVSQQFLAAMEGETRRRGQPTFPGAGIFMGGFFSTNGEHGPGCLFTTIAHEPAYHDYSTGFRCCKDAR